MPFRGMQWRNYPNTSRIFFAEIICPYERAETQQTVTNRNTNSNTFYSSKKLSYRTTSGFFSNNNKKEQRHITPF